MQIAQVLSGYSLGEADILRRAMGKKKPEEMAKQREKFVTGAAERGIPVKTAEYIFDLMEKFAGYGFNKSHSAAYALIAYQTAWLKTHYPAEFMAAVLSSDMDNTDKTVNFLAECRLMQLTVLPPNINVGQYMFTVNAKGIIEYGLGAIKGAGEAAIVHLVAEREKNGAFSSLFDFCQRLDLRKINRRVLEPLVRSGAMDIFGQHRAALMGSIDAALKTAEQYHRNLDLGQGDLFGETAAPPRVDYVECPPWQTAVRLQGEKEVLGLYLSGHPLEIYQQELSRLGQQPVAQLEKSKQGVVCGGVLIRQRIIMTRKGTRMAVVALEDLSGVVEVTIFSQLYDQIKSTLVIDGIFLVRGNVEEDTYTGGVRIVAEAIDSLSSIRSRFARRLKINLASAEEAALQMNRVSELIQPFRGGRCEVVISYQGQQADAQLVLGENWRVSLSDELLEQLRQACRTDQFAVEY